MNVFLKIVGWDEYTEVLTNLYKDVMLREFDEIVAMGRGGSIIGAYLAEKMGLPTFHPIFVRHVGRGEEMKIVVSNEDEIKSLRGSLLLVDDWLAEGRAMTFILDLIPEGVSVTTMVMFSRKGSEFKPDIVGKYVDENEREIMFPYSALG